MSVILEKRPLNQQHYLGMVTLDEPKSLNALNAEMTSVIFQQLIAWQEDTSVVAVFIDSSNAKAFCAGGDIKALYHNVNAGNHDTVKDFFELEYLFNYTMHSYPKPIITWGEGLVMGGGMGVFSAGSHRVVCDNSKLSMPEMKIGFFPDVGASYFLQRLFANAGLFIGLTAEFVQSSDAILIGLADYKINNDVKNNVLLKLSDANWSATNHHSIIDSVLHSFNQSIDDQITDSEYVKNFDFLQQFSRSSSVDEAMTLLQKSSDKSDWLKNCYQRMAFMSPFSCAVFFQQLKQSEHYSLKDVFNFERDIALNLSKAPDFIEGIRAVLIDKDNNANWQYSDVFSVDSHHVKSIFSASEHNAIV